MSVSPRPQPPREEEEEIGWWWFVERDGDSRRSQSSPRFCRNLVSASFLSLSFARDGMQRKDWLCLVSVHCDCWLLTVSFCFGARLNVTREHYICLIGILSKTCDTWKIWRLVEKVMVSTNHNIPRSIWVAVLQITEYLLGSVKTAHPQLLYETMIYRGLFKMEVCKHVHDILLLLFFF
ncbi:uncharacterized protein LOC106434987 isoform X1 [Brassica napus]|uniref:PHD finger protein ALFIN-LIKE n=1 Tax=Brassica napus TaxID=3708 RepID=A0A816RKD7_BRANA|nr:uncharacterized protein LOC106434987 isoform X1 [Brassica napus]CAF2076348.1 unnamed protein product [Brassica napus]